MGQFFVCCFIRRRTYLEILHICLVLGNVYVSAQPNLISQNFLSTISLFLDEEWNKTFVVICHNWLSWLRLLKIDLCSNITCVQIFLAVSWRRNCIETKGLLIYLLFRPFPSFIRKIHDSPPGISTVLRSDSDYFLLCRRQIFRESSITSCRIIDNTAVRSSWSIGESGFWEPLGKWIVIPL